MGPTRQRVSFPNLYGLLHAFDCSWSHRHAAIGDGALYGLLAGVKTIEVDKSNGHCVS